MPKTKNAKKKAVDALVKSVTPVPEPELEQVESVTPVVKQKEEVEGSPDVLDDKNKYLLNIIMQRHFFSNKTHFNRQLYHLLGQNYGYHQTRMSKYSQQWRPKNE